MGMRVMAGADDLMAEVAVAGGMKTEGAVKD